MLRFIEKNILDEAFKIGDGVKVANNINIVLKRKLNTELVFMSKGVRSNKLSIQYKLLYSTINVNIIFDVVDRDRIEISNIVYLSNNRVIMSNNVKGLGIVQIIKEVENSVASLLSTNKYNPRDIKQKTDNISQDLKKFTATAKSILGKVKSRPFTNKVFFNTKNQFLATDGNRLIANFIDNYDSHDEKSIDYITNEVKPDKAPPNVSLILRKAISNKYNFNVSSNFYKLIKSLNLGNNRDAHITFFKDKFVINVGDAGSTVSSIKDIKGKLLYEGANTNLYTMSYDTPFRVSLYYFMSIVPKVIQYSDYGYDALYVEESYKYNLKDVYFIFMPKVLN